jgi:CTP synthase
MEHLENQTNNYSNSTNNTPHVTKQIFVTGGVVSSLGKGLTASSLGLLLRSRGVRVLMQKIDPYLNIDPGTMNPFQHGEVFVTEDGAEADLDLGHYERFLDVNLSGFSNATTGQYYEKVLRKERAGEYLGDTVQIIPHITDTIKESMRSLASDNVDVIITEIGGTVGDIEAQPYLEAARQLRHELGQENVFFVHVSLVPYIGPSKELKTKPTQHSVIALRSTGILPNAIVLRSDRPVGESIKNKIALMCDVDAAGVVNCPDAQNVYDIPSIIHDEGLDDYILKYWNMKVKDLKWDNWQDMLERMNNPKHKIEIALVGKYISLPDAYLSVTTALYSAGFANWANEKIRWVASDTCKTQEGAKKYLSDVDGIVVPGGFGVRGIDGKIGALRFARENNIPTLGLCLGLQSMVIEFARNVLGYVDASSTEFDDETQTPTKHPVIATMKEQLNIVDGKGDMGGTMRLGAFDAVLKGGSIVAGLYGREKVSERHRHRYEVNNAYRAELEERGLIVSGESPDKALVEFVELRKDLHPFYVSTQAHPEFKSRPTKAHPLFRGLIAAAIDRKAERKSKK